MKTGNITKTIFLIVIVAMMQIAVFAQKAELIVQTGHTASIYSIAFSPNGKIIASGSEDRTIKLWDVETGKELRTVSGKLKGVQSVIFSPNSKILASCDGYFGITLWNVENGNKLRTFLGSCPALAFSPDGRILASGDADKTIKFWDVETGVEIKTLIGNSSHIETITFSPDGKMLASGNYNNIIKLWDVETGNEIQTLLGHTNSIRSVAFSPDGKTLASGSSDNTARLWDVKSGAVAQIVKMQLSSVDSIAFSNDGNTLAASSQDGTIKTWNLRSGKEIRILSDFEGVRSCVKFSPDSKILALGGSNKTIELWDIENGNKLKSLGGNSSFIDVLAFSPDAKTLASGNRDNTIKLWDVTGQKILNSLKGHKNPVISITFSPDGKILASASKDMVVKIWNVETGVELNTFFGHLSDAISLSFSSDGKFLGSGDLLDAEAKAIVWNIENGKIIADGDNSATQQEIIKLKTRVISRKYKPKVDINPYGEVTLETMFGNPVSENYVAKRSENGRVKLFEKNTEKELVSLIALSDNDWAVVDPEGRFDASPGAQKLMHYVVGLEPVDLEQIKDRYYTPNLLQRIFKGENLDATRKVSAFTASELYPLAEYAPLKENETVVNVKLKNRGGGIGRVQVFVNGAEFLADARPKGFNAKSQSAELRIDFSAAKTLKKGEPNSIKIIARNEAGWLRDRGSELAYVDNRKKDEVPQEFYAIIGGVSDYENNAFNLRYSAKDARDFAKAVELGATKLFGKERVHIRLLASGAGNENGGLAGADSKTLVPTKENFRRAFEEFRQAKPTDVFVVYLAGHGTSINKGGDTGDTYLYLTQEAVTIDKSRLLDEKLRQTTTVSSDELADWIRDVPALKRAMILDTCAAGAVEASLVKPRDLSPDQIKALDRMKDRTGFYVLMGSAADAQSYEATRYGQGLLTYSLLQGMSGAKLRDGEYADISTLFNYAGDQVVEMAKGIGGIQQPRIIAPTESRSFDIGRFSGQEKSKFTLAKVKPLILQPQLSNDRLKFDNLKLSQMVAKALRDESSTLVPGNTEAKLVFVDADEMPGAVTPGGVYEIVGDQIKVTLILVKNNEPMKTIRIEGSVADREGLSRKIVRSIVENTAN